MRYDDPVPLVETAGAHRRRSRAAAPRPGAVDDAHDRRSPCRATPALPTCLDAIRVAEQVDAEAKTWFPEGTQTDDRKGRLEDLRDQLRARITALLTSDLTDAGDALLVSRITPWHDDVHTFAKALTRGAALRAKLAAVDARKNGPDKLQERAGNVFLRKRLPKISSIAVHSSVYRERS